ncbi:Uncharacterized membrane protein YeiH [Peptostreptococcaceae bacterium pGA-8]|nr:Uncharacterized membrane protein YeiH [Peptostreptococcaceae bacterium pGA-8]
MTVSFIDVMDIIGTIAFAISGAAVAARKGMDIFGINILALVTATGGGIIRDVVIGKVPPMAFQNPIYLILSLITANIAFLVMLKRRDKIHDSFAIVPERAFFWFDTMGLAAFSVDGAGAGFNSDSMSNLFLIVFLGVVTGVGGGIIRDMMACEMPYVFVKHVYALASLTGALTTGVLMVYRVTGMNTALIAGFAVTIFIRVLAAHFKWNLPRITEGK